MNRDLLDFAAGNVAEECVSLLRSKFSEIFTRVVREQLFSEYCATRGLPILRDMLSKLMGCSVRSLQDNESLIVTNGCLQALSLIIRRYCQEGDIILVIGPTYHKALDLFKQHGCHVRSLLVEDAHTQFNTVIDQCSNDCPPRLVYFTGRFNNPTGKSLPPTFMAEMVKWAEENPETLIIEDDPYGELWFEDPYVSFFETAPSLSNVFYLGTFSKSLSPALRIGWAVAHKHRIAELAQIKEDTGTSPLTSAIVARFIDLRVQHYQDHMSDVREIYRSRREMLLEALTEHLSKYAEWETPHGGLYVWTKFKEPIPAEEWARIGDRYKYRVMPGSMFSPEDEYQHYARLCFASAPKERFNEGIERIAISLSRR